jgi:hypothetical protein
MHGENLEASSVLAGSSNKSPAHENRAPVSIADTPLIRIAIQTFAKRPLVCIPAAPRSLPPALPPARRRRPPRWNIAPPQAHPIHLPLCT